MVKKLLFVDVETFSDVDLQSCGVYAYTDSPNFKIQLLSFAYDDDPVQVIDLEQGEKIPIKVINDLLDFEVLKVAHNANFERTTLQKHTHLQMHPASWYCTAVRASTLGLPRSLDEVGNALNLDKDDKKMSVGKTLVQYFSKPCKPTKANGARTANLPRHDPAKWSLYKEYNRQDVATERVVYNKLLCYPETTESERRLWSLDQYIIASGVMIDTKLVDSILSYTELHKAAQKERAVQISGVDNPNSLQQIKRWLEAKGIAVESLNKAGVASLIETLADDEPEVAEFLSIRQELGKTSVAKYDAMARAKCSDNRVRGMLQFYGAERTGRWAGRIVQLQNLPKNFLKDLDTARSLVRDGDFETVELLYPSVMQVLSQLIRTAFIAEDGNTFVVADYSAIEARVIAWLAGEDWRIRAFNGDGKIYEASYARAFKVPVDSIKKGSKERGIGKIMELACVAKGSLIITNKGLTPIEKVKKNMLVWDGAEFVQHDGVVYKGLKEVITYEGLTATADHLVWVEGAHRPIYFGDAASGGKHLLQSKPSRVDFRECKDNKRGTTIPKTKALRLYGNDGVRSLRERFMAVFIKSTAKIVKRLSALFTAASCTEMVGEAIHISEAKMREPENSELSQLWRSRYKILLFKRNGGRHLDDRELWSSRQMHGARQDRCRQKLRTRKSPVGNTPNQLSKPEKRLAETFDILNCGPKHRYTANGVVVHNCGYGGGINALKKFGADEMGLNDTELQRIVDSWRIANPNIVRFWKKVEDAAKKAIQHPGSKVELDKGLVFLLIDGVLFVTLPSGRAIAYWGARLTENGYRTEVRYMGKNQTTQKWEELNTYGGKFAENITQAVARDCLGAAMVALDDNHYDIQFHVHDEVVIEVRSKHAEKHMDDIREIMALKSVDWVKGLPLTADAFITPYYRKD